MIQVKDRFGEICCVCAWLKGKGSVNREIIDVITKIDYIRNYNQVFF